jgi:hypothetical protein
MFERVFVRFCHALGKARLRQWCPMLSLLSLLLGGPVLAWVRTVYTRLSGTNDRGPFRPERTGDFPVAQTKPQRICFAALCIRGYRPSHRPVFICMEGTSSQEVVDALTIQKNVWVGR